MGVDSFAIDMGLAMSPIIVKVAETLPWNLSLPDETWKELGAGPDLWSKSVPGGNRLGDDGAGWGRRVCWR
jgi:hypothetical protein